MSQFPMVGSVVTFTRLRETLFPNGWKNVVEKFQRLETLRGCAVVMALRAAREGASEKHRYKGLDCAPADAHGFQCLESPRQKLSNHWKLWLCTLAAFLCVVCLVQSDEKPSGQVPAGEAKDWEFLDNGQIRIGIKKISGGAVAWLSRSGSDQNVLNHWDHGRLIQQSYYGAKDGSLWNKKPWRWNPVQGGDWKGIAAKVLELKVEKNLIYVKTLPKHWASGADLTETVMEEWIRLSGNVAHVHYKMTYTGETVHPETHHEIPAVFVDPYLDTLVLYDGDRPWTGGALHRSQPGWPNEKRNMTEHWAAYVNQDDIGVGVMVPKSDNLTCYRFGKAGQKGACSYFAPLTKFAFTPGTVFEYDVYLTLGSSSEIRQTFKKYSGPKQIDEEKLAQVVPLLDDTRVERGFTVWSPAPGSHVKQGVIRPNDATPEPQWGLAQWHSRFTLAVAKREQLSDGSARFADGAKAVTFFPPGNEADISFALNGNLEYDGKAPQRGDPWPHLLAERKLSAHPAITELESLRLSIRYRLMKAEIHRPDGFDPRRHTAQFVFFITVQNRNRKSPGFGDYYWFGVPLYDARDRLPRAHKAVDKGSDRKPATGKFIFNPGGECYTTNSAHDGDWVTIDKDLLPLMREGLETAWDKGFLQDSRNPADYCLGGMNTGWEVTGPLDVEVQIEGLRLEAVQKGN